MMRNEVALGLRVRFSLAATQLDASFDNSQLANVILSGADARGASGLTSSSGTPNTGNLIQYNGRIAGLDLPAGASLVVRDCDGNPSAFPPTGPLPIIVLMGIAATTASTTRR